MMLLVLVAVLSTLCGVASNNIDAEAFKTKVDAAIAKVDSILTDIETKWQVKEYPGFLKTMSLTHTGWEVLKVGCTTLILFIYIQGMSNL